MKLLTIDFGSTFTKVTAIDSCSKKVIGTAKAFTTIETDIRDGLSKALAELEKQCGKLEFDQKLACSSAGGGLKMIAVGLVPDLTAKAARMAASSAGAKVMKTYSYELSDAECVEIAEAKPDIILLTGGTDGGNKDVILWNAKKLALINEELTVIIAGNKSVASDCEKVLLEAGKSVTVCKNVMPVFNQLEIEPAKSAIRDIFIKKIVEAKGLSKAQEMMSNLIIPTPLAVLEGCELLAKGYDKLSGFGEFMAVDVGGATTDVYSMADGKPQQMNVLEKGLPEPFAKRSVEGDLGLRYSMVSLVETAGASKIISETGIAEEELMSWVRQCRANPELISQADTPEKNIDERIAQIAVEIAVERHVGRFDSVYTPFGESFMQTGKDLRNVRTIIGIGGPIINSIDPKKILSAALYSDKNPSLLKPENPKMFLDKKYIFASMGLVSQIDPELALELMISELFEV